MIFSPPHLEDGARWAGLRVGLLGGSFNPPHEGHVHASLAALATLKLDAVWWLVTPQNPLKERLERSYEDRFADCLEFATDPRLIVSDLERQMDTNLTWQTIKGLNLHFPRTSFAWITGMDNALTMHTWNNWTYILDHVATAHVARPPAWSLIENCPLKMRASQTHICLDRPRKAPLIPGYTYWILQKRLVSCSSTALRNQSIKTKA